MAMIITELLRVEFYTVATSAMCASKNVVGAMIRKIYSCPFIYQNDPDYATI